MVRRERSGGASDNDGWCSRLGVGDERVAGYWPYMRAVGMLSPMISDATNRLEYAIYHTDIQEQVSRSPSSIMRSTKSLLTFA